MKNNKESLIGPTIVARQLQNWPQSDSPDIINATTQYIAQEWLKNRRASSKAVYSVYVMSRDLSAKGDVEAAAIACALERLLVQHGFLEIRLTIGPTPKRRRSDLIGQTRH